VLLGTYGRKVLAYQVSGAVDGSAADMKPASTDATVEQEDDPPVLLWQGDFPGPVHVSAAELASLDSGALTWMLLGHRYRGSGR